MREVKTNQFRFKDEAERRKTLNRFLFLGCTVLYLVFAVCVTLESKSGQANSMIAMVIDCLVVVMFLMNLVFALKKPAWKSYKVVLAIQFAIIYLLAGIGSETIFIHFAIV